MTETRPLETRQIKDWSDIPGFFRWVDRWVFATVLEAQRDSPPGHLVELGTYQAKSSVIIGSYLRPGERFVAVDLFGREDLLDSSASGTMNKTENRAQYVNLSRAQFEHNYLALHDILPEVHEGLSTDIVDLVEPQSARFIHVDAGHMYDQVRQDVVNAKTILRPGGIVAFDDYRTEHTPGVSAAVWQAVFFDGLVPVAITPQKMYAIHSDDDPEPYREALKAFVASNPQKWWMQEQSVLGRPLLRIKHRKAVQPARAVPAGQKAAGQTTSPKAVSSAPAVPAGQKTTAPRTPHKPATAVRASVPRRVLHVIARDLAPPALTRFVRAHRNPWKSPSR